MVWFIERLTLRGWVGSVLPQLLRRRITRQEPIRRCEVIDATPPAMALARACRWLTGAEIASLRFRLIEVRDDEGLLLRLRIAFKDLAAVQAEIVQQPAFQEALQAEVAGGGRLAMYLRKSLATTSLSDRGTVWRALLVAQICAWKRKQEPGDGSASVLWLERRPWWPVLARYAAGVGLTVLPLPPAVSPRAWLLDHLSPALIGWLRRSSDQWARPRHAKPRVGGWSSTGASAGFGGGSPHVAGPRAPRVAVDYYGQLNLAQPERS